MGILADLFVATPPEAAVYEETLLLDFAAVEEQYDPAHFRGLTDLNFSVLWAMLADEEWDLKKHALTTITLEEPGETWLFQFPQPFCEKLAALSDEEVRSVSQAWAASEELTLDRWTVDDVLPVVERLRELSKRAIYSDNALFLWGSL
tara:strand:+ start:612 stop:1055 length:444 start_codon:yes stop_codon:yes gene_type:complete